MPDPTLTDRKYRRTLRESFAEAPGDALVALCWSLVVEGLRRTLSVEPFQMLDLTLESSNLPIRTRCRDAILDITVAKVSSRRGGLDELPYLAYSFNGIFSFHCYVLCRHSGGRLS